MKKRWLVFLSGLLILNACGSGQQTQEGSKNNSNNPPGSVAEALQRGEENGTFPKLNRDQTLLGQDKDHNGIRDDIDRYISSLPDNPEQKAALRQLARALENSLTVNKDEENALMGIARKVITATSCVSERYETPLSDQRIHELEKYIINTKNRFEEYDSFNQKLSGNSFVLPQGDGCEK